MLVTLSFLSYINDLPDEVVSRIFLFADDTKFYREIMNPSDVQLVKSDLNMLDSWSKKWHLLFHLKNVCSCQLVGRS